MTAEENRRRMHQRIRLVKRLMRPLPRRATIHRYPVLKWFAEGARKRHYLWSFRREHIIPACYIGCILAMMPLYGIQIGTAFLLAILLRQNLMMMVGLQLVTNPATVVFLYGMGFVIGDQILQYFGATPATMKFGEFMTMLQTDALEAVAAGWRLMIRIAIGGLLLGYFMGFLTSATYQIFANRSGKVGTIVHGTLGALHQLKKQAEQSSGKKKETEPISDVLAPNKPSHCELPKP